jgi:hypothetical protein
MYIRKTFTVKRVLMYFLTGQIQVFLIPVAAVTIISVPSSALSWSATTLFHVTDIPMNITG